jgi:hypothetical protein
MNAPGTIYLLYRSGFFKKARFLEKAFHGIGYLSALSQPVLNFIRMKLAFVFFSRWVIRSQHFQKTAFFWTP